VPHPARTCFSGTTRPYACAPLLKVAPLTIALPMASRTPLELIADPVERSGPFGHVQSPPGLATQLMKRRGPAEGEGQVERMRDRFGNRDGLITAAQRLVGIAEMP
jgi:hypothetical protein